MKIITLCWCALMFQAGALRAQPAVSLSPASLAFGTQVAGSTSAPQTSVLTNTGNATLNITSISHPGSYFRATSCGATLAPGASCNLNISFSPSKAGVLNNALSITDDAPGSPHKVKVSGTGLLVGAGIAPTNLTFGTVPVGQASAGQKVTLTNQGTSTLTVTSIASTSDDFVATGQCGSLAPNASCSINVTFSPTDGGTRGGSLTISDTDQTSPQLVALNGTGLTGAASISPATLNFGNKIVTAVSKPMNLTLTNTGTTTLNVLSIVASGDYSQTNTCSGILAAGGICTIAVSFAPLAAGSRPGNITLASTDAISLHSIKLSGTGTIPASTVTVAPRVTSITSAQTTQFAAMIGGVPSTNVSWFVNGVKGGNPNIGTISSSGLYTPPATSGMRLVKAVSIADTTQAATAQIVVTNYSGTYTYHNDNSRTGQNTSEIVLTTGNVNSTQFGKQFSYPVDGYIYTQPLYVPGVNIPGKGTHNVVYVATEHDSVYAFDADNLSSTPLWEVSFIDPPSINPVPSADVLAVDCESIGPEVGITGTPVIDPSTNTIFVVARTKELSGQTATYVQRLHALDITTGAERPNSPVVVEGSVPGSGEDSVNGRVSFDPLLQHSRVSLTLVNGVIYTAWASLCDRHPYHGWVFGWNAATLSQVAIFNTSPTTSASGIWQGGAGLAADAAGFLYTATGNGTFDIPSKGSNWGDSVLKMSTSSGLSVADYFTPSDQETLTNLDLDLGSGGILLLPDQPAAPSHLLTAVGKEGTIYLVNRDNLGGFNTTSNSQIVQTIYAATGEIAGVPSYYNNQIYFWGFGNYVKAYYLYQGLLSQSPLSTSTKVKSGYPGPLLAVSANGTTNGIVWAIETDGWKTGSPSILRAYNAADVSQELYDSTQAGARDQAGAAIRFAIPTVANGRVYVTTGTELDVYGLFP